MAKQMHQTLDNLETVLMVSGLLLANVVCLSFYPTDIGAFYNDAVLPYRPRLEAMDCRPSATLLGVTGLFHPDLMIETEATAVVCQAFGFPA